MVDPKHRRIVTCTQNTYGTRERKYTSYTAVPRFSERMENASGRLPKLAYKFQLEQIDVEMRMIVVGLCGM